MRKPKSKKKQLAAQKRGRKRSLRFKASRQKVARKRDIATAKRQEERRKYEEFMKSMLEARMKGEF